MVRNKKCRPTRAVQHGVRSVLFDARLFRSTESHHRARPGLNKKRCPLATDRVPWCSDCQPCRLLMKSPDPRSGSPRSTRRYGFDAEQPAEKESESALRTRHRSYAVSCGWDQRSNIDEQSTSVG